MAGKNHESQNPVRRGKTSGSIDRQHPSMLLSAMHSTQIVQTKAVLPAELIDIVLEYLPVPDLLRFARVSRQMKEMVYEDSRWVPRLQSMGCWNELEARKRAEVEVRRKDSLNPGRTSEELRRSKAGLPNSTNGTTKNIGKRKPGTPLFDAGLEGIASPTATPELSGGQDNVASVTLEKVPLSPTAAQAKSQFSKRPPSVLDVFATVHSVRGTARQEYGKVYRALAPYYNSLVKSQNPSRSKLFVDFSDPMQQAKMMAQLQVFAKSDFSLGWQRRLDTLDSTSALFENAALHEFEQAYRAKDIQGKMRTYAHVLVKLNGGMAAIDLYVDNSELIQSPYLLGNPMDCLRSVNPGDINLQPSLAFYEKLSNALQQESVTTDLVFPRSVDVMTPFLNKVGDRCITPFVTPLFDEAHSFNNETYLKAVAGVYQQSMAFIQSLAQRPNESDSFQNEAKLVIERAFEPHVDLYLKEEVDFLRGKCVAEVDRWEKRLSEQEASAESYYMSNVQRQAAKQDFMSSFKKVLMAPVNVLPTFSSTKTSGSEKSQSQDMSRAVTPNLASELESHRALSPRPEAPTTELAAQMALMNSKLEGISSLFSIEIALTLVHLAKASLERACRFIALDAQAGIEVKAQCELLFLELLQVLGFRHVCGGFDKAIGHLETYTAKEASNHDRKTLKPLVTFLELVNVGDLIQQMLDVFYIQELVTPKIVDRDDFLDSVNRDKKRFEQLLDEKVASGLNKGIDALLDEVEYICATTQTAADFNPGATGEEHASVLDISATPAAAQVVELVSSHTSMLVGSTDKNTLDVFNQEVGMRLFVAFCKHLKRQRISQAGAIKLIADTNLYYEYIATLKNKELLQYFKALRELSQIFLVDGSHSKEIATIIADSDRYHGVFRAEEVYEFAERRADWYEIKKKVERAMYGIGCIVM